MLVLLIVAFTIAMIFAIILVGARSGVTSQAKRLIDANHISDLPRAKRTLKVLATVPRDMQTLETDRLHDDLQRLIHRTEEKRTNHNPIGFKAS